MENKTFLRFAAFGYLIVLVQVIIIMLLLCK